MWPCGAQALFQKSGNAIPVTVRCLGNLLKPVKICPPVTSVLPKVQTRQYLGSNRNKRSKAVNKKLDLERQLEHEYGIGTIPGFSLKEWFKTNYFSEFNAFQARLNIKFNKNALLISAFAHPSFVDELDVMQRDTLSPDTDADMLRRFEINDERAPEMSYQKLSLLGYNATASAIKDAIYAKYPNITPSICNDIYTFLVSRDTIGMVAKNLGMDELVLLSRELDEFDSGDNLDSELHLKFSKEDLLCDTFYSVVGAIEVDLDHPAAKSFVNDFVVVLMNFEDLSEHVQLQDANGELRKILSLNEVYGRTNARTILEAGVETDFPFFQAGVYINGCQVGLGSGYSASTAREDAFRNAVFSCLEGDVEFTRLRRENAVAQ